MNNYPEFKTDLKAISNSIKEIEQQVKYLSDVELNALWKRGHIPTGLLNYLMACRVSVV